MTGDPLTRRIVGGWLPVPSSGIGGRGDARLYLIRVASSGAVGEDSSLILPQPRLAFDPAFVSWSESIHIFCASLSMKRPVQLTHVLPSAPVPVPTYNTEKHLVA
ncbi:hypothetical protein PCASD_00564 [Puccinia coronata f. sp. avenae]|uniref:Uncharacterized protein n=1 Tax=Puccinia coronata f. sp. avenae TaxID=200324 RepID=A0A2N5VP61_9BASI|nr:hypothetical protein PCASD_00564 [Puccinia coronata f. sp. avenae]